MTPRTSVTNEQAQVIAKGITALLQDKHLVAIQVIGDDLPRVETKAVFREISVIDYRDGRASLMLSFKDSVIPGLAEWKSDPSMRALHAITTNGPGQIVRFTWIILPANQDEHENNYRALQEFEKVLWRTCR